MFPGRGAFLFIFFTSLFFAVPSSAQASLVGTCTAFASNGDLLTGTIEDGKLELRLSPLGKPTILIGEPIENTKPCEISFSSDGKWAVIVAVSNELMVFVIDRATGTVHSKFSSSWLNLRNMPLERGYQGNFLGGFAENDSLVLWRYAPRPVANTNDGSNVEIRRQLWSIDGELLVDQDLGRPGWSGWRTPIALGTTGVLWLAASCNATKTTCFRELRIRAHDIEDGDTISIPDSLATTLVPVAKNDTLFAVAGSQETEQQALLLDRTGHVLDQAKLPFIRNLFQPLVPDWFGVRKPEVSADGEMAAVARTRVAWVLVDTDRDWGSEIILLRMHPLSVLTTYKTGRGGIGSFAVDHHNDGVIRVVGYWKHRWNNLRCDQSGKCKNTAL